MNDAQQLLQNLGADTSGSLHLEPDGTFPNHLANPEVCAAINELYVTVTQHDN